MLGMGMDIHIDAMLSRSYIGLADGYTHRMEVAATVNVGGMEMDDMAGDMQITLAAAVDLAPSTSLSMLSCPRCARLPLGMMLAMGES